MAGYQDFMRIVLPTRSGETPRLSSGVIRNNGTPHGGWDFSYQNGQAGIISSGVPFSSPINGVVTRVETPGRVGTLQVIASSSMIEITDVFGMRHQFMHAASSNLAIGSSVYVGTELGIVGNIEARLRMVGEDATQLVFGDYHVHYQIRLAERKPDGSEKPLYNPDIFWANRTPESFAIIDGRTSTTPMVMGGSDIRIRRITAAIADEVPVASVDTVSPDGSFKLHIDEFIDGGSGNYYFMTRTESSTAVDLGITEVTANRDGTPLRTTLRMFDTAFLTRDLGQNALLAAEDAANKMHAQLMASFGYVVNSQGLITYSPTRILVTRTRPPTETQPLVAADGAGYIGGGSSGASAAVNIASNAASNRMVEQPIDQTVMEPDSALAANLPSPAVATSGSADFVNPWRVMHAGISVSGLTATGAAPTISSQPVLGSNDLLLAGINPVRAANDGFDAFSTAHAKGQVLAAIA
jgi:hypothetical protein